MRRPLPLALIAIFALISPPAARAHGVGQSQLTLRIDGRRLEGEFLLNLNDARKATGLDPSLSGAARWDDLRAHEPQLREIVLRSLAVRADSLACPLTLDPTPMTWNPRFDDVRFLVRATCPVAPTRLTLHEDFLFDVVPTYRGYFSVEDARSFNVGVLRAHERTATFRVRQFHAGEIALEFVRDGVNHIWTGLDHLLFLLALLLPAALVRVGRDWQPRPGLSTAIREVLKVVTAFTLAHSITLALAFFGVIRLPSQWIEVGIAVSVFAAAWNNLRPFLPGRAWLMAFGFGLIHGMGFAGALANLALPSKARGLALASFNIGVELGQIAIVLLVLPALYLASRRSWYPRIVMGVGSLGIAFVAVVWILERAFGLVLFSR
jgi:hypothetical protein